MMLVLILSFPLFSICALHFQGLEFLANHAEFQEKYAVTVITRIFYSVNKCHSGRITSRQVRRSDLLESFSLVDEEEDINKVTRYFSYEHFYVLYCRFWELDHDRDYRITREDLLKYGDHSLSHMIVDRIFDSAPRPFEHDKVDREHLSYEDFIYFMLSGKNALELQLSMDDIHMVCFITFLIYYFFSCRDRFRIIEEDKSNEVSVRYWFNCVDVDGDGRLNNMEMRSFYAVQLHRMQCMGHEIVPFEDMLCQMMDMIKPTNPDHLVVEDFMQPECSQVSGALFDALFNLNKYLLFEQRDPFVERQKREDEFETDWDRFACIDYNRLAMEEEAREEEAMEIDWVTVDEDEEEEPEFNGAVSSEAPF
ncbi:MAG: serine/threonine-protein phosphatase 2A regulatory subunit B'' [Bacillariaceae sp.]|jgi:serine/threonine-protein phosphatase 2A regulatory subunit B''